MKPIDKIFQKYGFTHRFTYRQLRRDGHKAMYQARDKHGKTWWEVIRIRQVPAQAFPNGRITPAREKYPSSEQFGTHAWCYSNANGGFKAATLKYNKLTTDR